MLQNITKINYNIIFKIQGVIKITMISIMIKE
jgi:hypothetical protein